MICKTCHEGGKKNIIFEEGSQITLIGIKHFHDNIGRRHFHGLNKTTTRYRCSEGHSWLNTYKKSCWCGWPNKEIK